MAEGRLGRLPDVRRRAATVKWRPMRRGHRGFTLLELLIVIAILGILMALMLPALARAKGTSYRASCLGNLRQIGLGFEIILGEDSDRFPDFRGLKATLGFQPWSSWPPSDPRGGWAAEGLRNQLPSRGVWVCPALQRTTLWDAVQVAQLSIPGDADSAVRYWLWRFDRTNDPAGLDNFWGKTVEQCVQDLQVLGSPVTGSPAGPADVELAVDPYFPRTIPTVLPELRGKAAHRQGRNRLFLDGHAEFLRDARLD
jgi:prepilin-type N-terminal cleavage/methylation domain-containing protein/prepilin-type processing-associated H-X9-DG protein